MLKAKEKQNQIQFDNYWKKPIILGPFTSHIYRSDPKHIGFLFARYKFVSKMLAGKNEVLEIGCGDATGTPVVANVVKLVYAVDFEPLLIDDNKKRLQDFPNIKFSLLDITEQTFLKKCDAAFSLDVLEHISPKKEEKFISNICLSLKKDGICIIGTPNRSAEKYASLGSRTGHINLKTYKDFQIILKKYFINGMLFSMHDEIVHTGFYPMAQYLIAIGIGTKI